MGFETIIGNLLSLGAFLKSSPDKVGELRATVNGLKQELSRYSPGGSEEGFVGAMDKLLTFMRSYPDKEAFAKFSAEPDFIRFREFFSPYILRLAWDMEDRTFDEMMSRRLEKGQLLRDIMGNHTRGAYMRISDALNLADLSKANNYVMLGCGKVPSSIFYVHDHTDIKDIVGVDNLPEAVEKAQALVGHHGLSRISIVQADAREFDLSRFDVIYWGHFCTPRRSIMDNIIATARKDSIIILRDPFHTGLLGTESVLPYLDRRLQVCSQSEEYTGRFMLKHYLLKLR